MKLIKYILLGLFSFSGGLLVASGVFTVLVAVGLIPRFAEKTNTAYKVLWYEEMVVFGTITGCFLSIYTNYSHLDALLRDVLVLPNLPVQITENIVQIIVGIFAGIFVGCLALAIAEMLDSIPIFTRRISFQKGIGVCILFMAIGKMVGSFFYYFYGITN